MAMPITADPIIIPAKTLDKYWVHSFSVGTTGVNGVAMLHSSLLPYNDGGDIGPEIVLDTINVFEQLAVDPDAAQIFGLVMAYVEKKAKEQGKI
jgi:hypothetical protein